MVDNGAHLCSVVERNLEVIESSFKEKAGVEQCHDSGQVNNQ